MSFYIDLKIDNQIFGGCNILNNNQSIFFISDNQLLNIVRIKRTVLYYTTNVGKNYIEPIFPIFSAYETRTFNYKDTQTYDEATKNVSDLKTYVLNTPIDTYLVIFVTNFNNAVMLSGVKQLMVNIGSEIMENFGGNLFGSWCGLYHRLPEKNLINKLTLNNFNPAKKQWAKLRESAILGSSYIYYIEMSNLLHVEQDILNTIGNSSFNLALVDLTISFTYRTYLLILNIHFSLLNGYLNKIVQHINDYNASLPLTYYSTQDEIETDRIQILSSLVEFSHQSRSVGVKKIEILANALYIKFQHRGDFNSYTLATNLAELLNFYIAVFNDIVVKII